MKNSTNNKTTLFSHIRYEHLVAGFTGGVASTLILHPLDLIKIRFAGTFYDWFQLINILIDRCICIYIDIVDSLGKLPESLPFKFHVSFLGICVKILTFFFLFPSVLLLVIRSERWPNSKSTTISWPY